MIEFLKLFRIRQVFDLLGEVLEDKLAGWAVVRLSLLL